MIVTKVLEEGGYPIPYQPSGTTWHFLGTVTKTSNDSGYPVTVDPYVEGSEWNADGPAAPGSTTTITVYFPAAPKIAGDEGTMGGGTFGGADGSFWDIEPRPAFSEISDAIDTSWSTAGTVSDSSDTTWKVLRAVSNSSNSSWNIKVKLSANKNSTWNVSGRPTRVNATQWSVRKVSSASRITDWRILGSLQPAVNTKWKVGQRVSTYSAPRWSISVKSTFTKSTTWKTTVGLAPAAIRETDWSSAGRTTFTNVTYWNDLVSAGRSNPTSWGIYGKLTGSNNSTWGIRARISDTAIARWNTLRSLSKTRNATWKVKIEFTKSADTTWADLIVVAVWEFQTSWDSLSSVTNKNFQKWNTYVTAEDSNVTDWIVNIRIKAPISGGGDESATTVSVTTGGVSGSGTTRIYSATGNSAATGYGRTREVVRK